LLQLSFDDITTDKSLRSEFKKHLETRLNAEYLYFWQEVRDWKKAFAKAEKDGTDSEIDMAAHFANK